MTTSKSFISPRVLELLEQRAEFKARMTPEVKTFTETFDEYSRRTSRAPHQFYANHTFITAEIGKHTSTTAIMDLAARDPMIIRAVTHSSIERVVQWAADTQGCGWNQIREAESPDFSDSVLRGLELQRFIVDRPQ